MSTDGNNRESTLDETKYRFSASIFKAGINPCVDVPGEISSALGGRGYIKVRGTLNATPFRATLVPVKGKPYRLYVNIYMRQQAGVGTGDSVDITLELDTEPRDLPVPRELAEVLATNPDARDRFEKLTPSQQREILAYLNSLKKTDTLKRNAEKIAARLVSGHL
ncbi:MAG: hypothetical protein A2147_00025 [Chloroflexi bacterium RBG_16_57_8]|nr:MAG: hypothetical protein A2147_00025 [Chloroflexi bacterium RBG_16_57_8]